MIHHNLFVHQSITSPTCLFNFVLSQTTVRGCMFLCTVTLVILFLFHIVFLAISVFLSMATIVVVACNAMST